MILDKDTLEHIATLARLKLTEAEKQVYAEQLSVIFDYIDMLGEVNTDDVEETCQVTGLDDVFREDRSVSCDPEVRKKMLEQFPDRKGDLLKVKAVFE